MWAFSELRPPLRIKVFAHLKLTGMASMQVVDIEILNAIFVGHVGGHVSGSLDWPKRQLSIVTYPVTQSVSQPLHTWVETSGGSCLGPWKVEAIPNHGRWGEVDNENDLD